MKIWFLSTISKIRQWIQGRYGYDQLSRFLFILTLALIVLSRISVLRFLYIPALLLLSWSCIRCYSTNHKRRRAEYAAYLRIKSFFSLQKRKWSERKTHTYFKCSSCKKTLRIPKRKGKMRITCPECGYVVEKRT